MATPSSHPWKQSLDHQRKIALYGVRLHTLRDLFQNLGAET